jgi:hypothetical protein
VCDLRSIFPAISVAGRPLYRRPLRAQGGLTVREKINAWALLQKLVGHTTRDKAREGDEINNHSIHSEHQDQYDMTEESLYHDSQIPALNAHAAMIIAPGLSTDRINMI